MYDNEPEDVEELGWEEFIVRQWESVFTGYRSWVGLRTIGRRWSDLIEAGLGCPQDVADRLVRAQVIDRADRDLQDSADAEAVLSGMVGVLVDLRAELAGLADSGELAELAGLGEPAPELPPRLLGRHARLLALIRARVFDGDVPGARGLAL